MVISGLQKLTLLDFPNLVACTVFLKGCNFKCPFCQNKDLVNSGTVTENISVEELLSFLKSRKKVLDGVCITGGEPTLQPELEDLIKEIKKLGYKVKLDTNGYNPTMLKKLINDGLVDYVAMDIKNSFTKYNLTCGLKFMDLSKIKESIDFLKFGTVPYEFRTTVVKEFHSIVDFIEIASMLQGASKYYLQEFRDSDTCIMQGLHAHSKEQMEEFKRILQTLGINVYLRGIE